MLKKFIFSALAAASLAGCATEAADYRYVGAVTAPREPVSLALNDCRAKSNMVPAAAYGASNPLYAASAQAQFVNDCMGAKGYRTAP